MDIRRMEINQREKKNFVTIHDRCQLAEKLKRNGYLKLGKDELTLLAGHLVHIKGSEPLHPLYKTPLDNPMTWDTFIHLYLLNK